VYRNKQMRHLSQTPKSLFFKKIKIRKINRDNFSNPTLWVSAPAGASPLARNCVAALDKGPDVETRPLLASRALLRTKWITLK